MAVARRLERGDGVGVARGGGGGGGDGGQRCEGVAQLAATERTLARAQLVTVRARVRGRVRVRVRLG